MTLDGWLERSYRRRLLDRDLLAVSADLRGSVLEIGSGRARRRGLFRPPTSGVPRWVCADLRVDARPDVRTDALRLAFRSGAFDTVVCLEVLEYVDRPSDVLREIGRVLQPGGSLLLSMPFLHRMDAPDDLWRTTEAGLRRLLERNGYEVVWSRRQGAAMATAANILKYSLWKGIRSGALRTLVALMAAPLLELLLRLDGPLAERRPELATFATGHLVMARKR